MIENILASLVSQNSQGAITENESISGDQKNSLMEAISGSLLSGLKGQVSEGNLAGIMDIFSKKETSLVGNSVMDGLLGSVTTMVAQKTGMNTSVIQGVVASVVPNIMGALGQKAGDSNDSSIDFNGIFSSLGGGNLNGIDANSMMDRVNDDNDKFDVGDVVNIVSNLANKNGGIAGMLGNLFGGK